MNSMMINELMSKLKHTLLFKFTQNYSIKTIMMIKLIKNRSETALVLRFLLTWSFVSREYKSKFKSLFMKSISLMINSV